VIAANYAFALGAGLHLIPERKRGQCEELLERFYSVYENRDRSPSDTLQMLRDELRELTGPIPVPPGGSITFIAHYLPYGYAFPEVPTTHLIMYPDLGIAVVQGFAAEQPEQPKIRVATLVNPETTPAPEIETAMKLLYSRHYFVRAYEGGSAHVSAVSDMIELFPYDLLLIATHCGDVSGLRWTYEFEDSEGIQRTLVVDIALGLGRADDRDLIDVTQFIRFVSLDGVAWDDPEKDNKLYVGMAIRDFMERTGNRDDLNPIEKETVSRVVGSAALKMSDHNLIALPRSLANESTPIVINNACVSGNFSFASARAYIGTLIPITSSEAQSVVERVLDKHFDKPLAVALWAAQRNVYGSSRGSVSAAALSCNAPPLMTSPSSTSLPRGPMSNTVFWPNATGFVGQPRDQYRLSLKRVERLAVRKSRNKDLFNIAQIAEYLASSRAGTSSAPPPTKPIRRDKIASSMRNWRPRMPYTLS